MLQYKYQDIQIVDKSGFIMYDGFKVSFQKCNEAWKEIKKSSKSCCTGYRDITAKKPYFRFFMDGMVIEILFDRKGLFKKQRNEKDFHKFMQHISKHGYSTFDLS